MIRLGELLAAAAAVALVVVMSALEWYAAGAGWTSSAPLARSRTAWEAFGVLDLLLLVPATLGLALALLTATRRSPALPVAVNLVLLPAALLASLALAYRLLVPPGGLGVATGAWLGLACSLALLAGAWLSLRDERPRAGAAEPVAVALRPAPPA